MAKLVLSLVLLAAMVLASEAATSFGSLCQSTGKPTKFKSKLFNGAKASGFAQYCFGQSNTTSYAKFKANKVDQLRTGVIYLGTGAAASGPVDPTAATLAAFASFDMGLASYTSTMQVLNKIEGAASATLKTEACALRVYAGLTTGPVEGPFVNQPATLMAKKTGNGC
ncbi:hypothetical protein Rsub_06807 [Raphidocelis subcapitata]|uniref:Uncharacterized protein n=1 Tax=Raphidocelis subcapitata TaxID=307507 RepID=A0A2V0P1G5_9CHLO|nr:hypothetical protein Rsub_06807 [Raphidocelis subcapitata]|eukprot:GBF93704.1 hypothetical protein Rsub_06807 [Raphidocelis subcapitata]